jgi:hypothetical protein
MKIYAIQYDSKLKCSLEVDCDEKTLFAFCNQFFRKNTESYLEKWNPPPCYHLDGEPGWSTFTGCYHILSYAFYDDLLKDRDLINLFEAYGEILPIPCSDSERTVYQYHCMNCLGRDDDFVVHNETAIWKATCYPDKMSFRKSQMPDRGLFWLDPSKTNLYTVENEELGIEHNFKMLYESRGYTGLIFSEIKLI